MPTSLFNETFCVLQNLPCENIWRDGFQVKKCICNLKHSFFPSQVWLDERHGVHLALHTLSLSHPKHSNIDRHLCYWGLKLLYVTQLLGETVNEAILHIEMIAWILGWIIFLLVIIGALKTKSVIVISNQAASAAHLTLTWRSWNRKQCKCFEAMWTNFA